MLVFSVELFNEIINTCFINCWIILIVYHLFLEQILEVRYFHARDFGRRVESLRANFADYALEFWEVALNLIQLARPEVKRMLLLLQLVFQFLLVFGLLSLFLKPPPLFLYADFAISSLIEIICLISFTARLYDG